MKRTDYKIAYEELKKIEIIIKKMFEKYTVTGSMRRKKSTIGDIDIVISGNTEEVYLKIETIPGIKSIDKNGNYLLESGMKLQIIAVPNNEYKYTVWSSTGSKAHVKEILLQYKNKNINFPFDFEEEKEIYEKLGIKYRVPEEREQ